MTAHPLTDQIIEEELITRDECLRREGDGRAMYYEEDFRVGADWQFGKGLRELLSILNLFEADGKITQDELEKTYFQFIETMRPTQENN